jgi:SAM-dependent methyltransferase
MPPGSGASWADDYERGRPGWPAEVVDVPGLPRSATVLEVGAGTGKLTRVLARAYARVLAVEPAEEMRRLLVARCPAADAIDGTAQELPLADASVDAVFVAEAFHKFQDERSVAELARVLRPGGALVLLWNIPGGPWEPAIDDVERLLLERGPKPEEVSYDPLDLDGPHYTSGAWRRPFEGSRFGELREVVLPNPQTVDREGLVAFLASMGWLGDLPDGERLPLLDEVRALLPADEYRRLWETHGHWARLER